jgi:SAM-dependent methyltransferase
MTRYLERALAGETPSVAEWNEHLVAYHREHTGRAEDWIWHASTAGGETSMDVLIRRIVEAAPHARDFLDIGCGDGLLLERIPALYGVEPASLTGIDLSAAQIEAARSRLPSALLRLGDASTTDLGSERYDVVSAHLSFMAMADTRSVVHAVRAALRRGGLFACVCEDPLGPDTVFRIMAKAVDLLRGSWPELSLRVPGRDAIENDNVLRDLLVAEGFNAVSIEHFEIGAHADTDQLWDSVVASYGLALLDKDVRDDLRARLGAELREACTGDAKATLALRLVLAYA